MIPYLALVICIAGVILGASSITLGSFGDSVDKCWNETYTYSSTLDRCNSTSVNDVESPGSPGRNFSTNYWVIWNAQEGEAQIGEQLQTVAIIGIMVVIISLIAGVFVYMKYFG